MLAGLGWTLQLLALAIVGSSLLVGLASNEIRAELAFAGGGGVLFLVGRWLQSRTGR